MSEPIPTEDTDTQDPGLTPEEVRSLYEFISFNTEGREVTTDDFIELWRRMGVKCPELVAERLITEAKPTVDAPLDSSVFVETMTRSIFSKKRIDPVMDAFKLFKTRHTPAQQSEKGQIPRDALTSILVEYAKLDKETAERYTNFFQPDSVGMLDFEGFLTDITDKNENV